MTTATFGQKVRALRKAKRWTQDDLGKKIDRKKSYVSQMENDLVGFSMEVAEAIAEAFDLPLALLLHPEIPIEDLQETSEFLEEFVALPPEKRKAVRQMILALRS